MAKELLRGGGCIFNVPNVMQLLHLIAEADAVVTHSYHGYILSINFNVEVYCSFQKDVKASERFTSVMETLDLPNKNIFYPNELDSSDYDWTNINKKIEQERERSIKYLKEITSNLD